MRIYINFIVGVLLLSILNACGPKEDSPDLLKRMQIEVHSVFTKVEAELKNAVKQLPEYDVTSKRSREVLDRLIDKFDYVDGCAIVDDKGNVIVFEPEKNNEFEGQNIAYQEHMVRYYENKKPVLSNVFELIEGGYGSVIVRPIVAKNKSVLGSVNVVIRPHKFLEDVFKPIVEGFPVDAWIMDLNGNIVYDPDYEEIGKNLFTDPLYDGFEELKAVAKQMQRDKSGIGLYKYYDNGTHHTVTKQMHWTTVQMYGTQWRLVMTQVLTKSANVVRSRVGSFASRSVVDRFDELAENQSLLSGLEAKVSDDAEDVSHLLNDVFAEFYKSNAGLYYLAWIDPTGIVRYAYPKENAVDVYDFHDNRTASDRLFLNVVETQKKSSFEISLPEGGKANIYALPVFKMKKFLGIIYMARKII